MGRWRWTLTRFIESMDGTDGDGDEPVWCRIEGLDDATIGMLLVALADDRRRVLAARLEGPAARGR